MNSYSKAEFAPLSQASLKRLIKGHTVRVKHGTGLHLNLSKMQIKKHVSSKKKGQGGYNMTLDPYQCQMHGEGFLDDVGNAFKQLSNSFVQNVAKPVANEVVKKTTAQGRKVASQLIREGIPFATSSLGGLAGSTLGGLSANPLAVPAGEILGQQLGEYGGKKLADYVGKKTGLGIPKRGGRLLIDEPVTTRQVVNTTGNFIKNPSKTLGFGIREDIMNNQLVRAIGKRGKRGGTLLIDQPFTTRQAVNTTGNFIKNPSKTLGFGMKKKMLGRALKQAGY